MENHKSNQTDTRKNQLFTKIIKQCDKFKKYNQKIKYCFIFIITC